LKPTITALFAKNWNS